MANNCEIGLIALREGGCGVHMSSLVKMQYFTAKYLGQYVDQPLKILDIGSQNVNGTYKQFFENLHWEYIGCDMEAGNNVDLVLKNVYDWKEIESDSIDVVITGQTFEHIEYPWLTMLEIARVLKTGGLCGIVAPASGPEHKYPVDCWRIYPDGFRALAKYAFLEVLEAFTEWNGKSYQDNSEIWCDSMLIAQKAVLTEEDSRMFRMKSNLSKLTV